MKKPVPYLIFPLSMSSASPLSRGSAIIVILFFLLGVSAKHFRLLVSTTVSQKATTGSATFTSISAASQTQDAVEYRNCGHRQLSPSPHIPGMAQTLRYLVCSCYSSKHASNQLLHCCDYYNMYAEWCCGRDSPPPLGCHTPAYISLRSFMIESRYSSPVPSRVCSPDSSTRVTARG